jgi:hypothetical protein
LSDFFYIAYEAVSQLKTENHIVVVSLISNICGAVSAENYEAFNKCNDILMKCISVSEGNVKNKLEMIKLTLNKVDGTIPSAKGLYL